MDWTTGMGLLESGGSGACTEDKINGSAISGWGPFRWQLAPYESLICYLLW